MGRSGGAMIRESNKRDDGRVKWFNIYIVDEEERHLIAKALGKGTAWHAAKGLEKVYGDPWDLLIE